MSKTYARISKVLDGKDKGFVACRVDESCGQAPLVPPDGGEVEVLVTQIRVIDRPTPSEWLDAEQEGLNRARENIKVHRELGGKLQYEIRELVDRAHVTRLQAENAALQQRLNVADQRADDLQSELTKAQECIAALRTLAFDDSATIYSNAPSYIVDMRNVLYAHRSAPAAKGGSHTACGYDCAACATGKAKP